MWSAVSVVIPCLNAGATLGRQLEALCGQQFEGCWEVIVADNGSTDGSGDVVARFHGRLPSLRLVDASRKRSACVARNEGVAAAHHNFIAFCDADDEVQPGWLAALAATGEDCDLVAGTVVVAVPMNSAAGVAGYQAASFPSSSRSGGFLETCDSANLGVSRAAFEAVGGFNEDYVVCGDDFDFGYRAQLAGFKLCQAPEAVVHARLRDSVRSVAKREFRIGLAGPHLYRDFRDRGMPGASISSAAAKWAYLVVTVPSLALGRQRRVRWVGRASRRAGRLVGCLRYRVFHP
ncbi:MAG: glycosyltransferase [Acidimicrobiales bacterium]